MSKSRSLTPTRNTLSSRKSTPTRQRHSTGNPHSNEGYHNYTDALDSVEIDRPGPSKSKRKRSSSASDSEHNPKRARVHEETDPDAMRYSPSIGSNDGSMDGVEAQNRQSPTPQPPAPLEKKKRTRTLTTPHQAAVLHALLAQSKFPTTAMREEVGRSIGLSARKVQIWFQNQRQKMRRPKTHVEHGLGAPDRPSIYPTPGSLSDPGPSGSLSSSHQGSPRGSIGPGLEPHPYSPSDPDRFAFGRNSSSSSYHGSFEAVPQLQGPGVPGYSSAPSTGYRDPSPRPSTGHSSYTTSGRSSLEGLSPTVPVFSHSSSSPIARRDPSRTLPPLLFPAPSSSSKRSSLSSSASFSSSRLSPIALSVDPDQTRSSPTDPSALPPPFALEPQPHWDPTAMSPLPSASFSSPRSSRLSLPSPEAHRSDIGETQTREAHSHESEQKARLGRYDPVRDGFVPTSPNDEKQRSLSPPS